MILWFIASFSNAPSSLQPPDSLSSRTEILLIVSFNYQYSCCCFLLEATLAVTPLSGASSLINVIAPRHCSVISAPRPSLRTSADKQLRLSLSNFPLNSDFTLSPLSLFFRRPLFSSSQPYFDGLIVSSATGALPVKASLALPIPVPSAGSPLANINNFSCSPEPQPSPVAVYVSVSVASSSLVLPSPLVVLTIPRRYLRVTLSFEVSFTVRNGYVAGRFIWMILI